MGGRRIKKNVSTNVDEILKMSMSEQIEVVATLAKRANTRMKALQKAGYSNDANAYGKAFHYLSKIGRTSFYEGKKYDNMKDGKQYLKQMVLNLTYFLNAESSTVKGLKKIEKRRYDTFAKNHGLIKEIMTTTGKTKKQVIEEHKDKFYEFLKSNQFKDMRSRIASDQLLDDFAMALMQGYTLEEIQKQYLEEQINEDITLDKIQEKYNRARWQLEKTNGGKLLGTKKWR